LFLYLAGSGARVTIPDAMSASDEDASGDVNFLANDGRIIAVFRRQDVLVYSLTDLGRIFEDDSGFVPAPGATT
jgi:hypothetical protein